MPSDGGPRSTLPVFYLYIVDKNNTKAKTRAGAVFQIDYGRYSLKLHPGISINWNDEVYLNLVPYEDKETYRRNKIARDLRKEQAANGEVNGAVEGDGYGPDDDDLLF